MLSIGCLILPHPQTQRYNREKLALEKKWHPKYSNQHSQQLSGISIPTTIPSLFLSQTHPLGPDPQSSLNEALHSNHISQRRAQLGMLLDGGDEMSGFMKVEPPHQTSDRFATTKYLNKL